MIASLALSDGLSTEAGHCCGNVVAANLHSQQSHNPVKLRPRRSPTLLCCSGPSPSPLSSSITPEKATPFSHSKPIIADRRKIRRNLFLLDVSPLCYRGKKPSPSALTEWLSLLFSEVTATEPIIAVMDGQRGNEYRRGFLPTYKGNRNAFTPLSDNRQTWEGDDADLREAFPYIRAFLSECHIPIVSLEDAEADDVVATLTEQAVSKGIRVTIASPDKDFKQLLCEKVQIVAPLADLKRWSFYTHKDYFYQHNIDPTTEISLRCMLGDKADNIPGLADIVPGFGRKTATKLITKYGSLENLLYEASKRTVAKPYIQAALTDNASVLRKNICLLQLRRDLPICLMDEWCISRDTSNDAEAFLKLKNHLKVLREKRASLDKTKLQSYSKLRKVGRKW